TIEPNGKRRGALRKEGGVQAYLVEQSIPVVVDRLDAQVRHPVRIRVVELRPTVHARRVGRVDVVCARKLEDIEIERVRGIEQRALEGERIEVERHVHIGKGQRQIAEYGERLSAEI